MEFVSNDPNIYLPADLPADDSYVGLASSKLPAKDFTLKKRHSSFQEHHHEQPEEQDQPSQQQRQQQNQSSSNRYLDWFRRPKKRWSLRRSPSLPNDGGNSSFSLHAPSPPPPHRLDSNASSSGGEDLSRSALLKHEKHKKDLEEATWNRHKRIALLDPSEIKLTQADSSATSKRIVNVESISLELTAEYLQQERYRLRLQNNCNQKQQYYSLKRIPPNPCEAANKMTLKRNGNRSSSSKSNRTKKKGLKLLVQEATILARLGEHPNIIGLRGLPFRTCPSLGFFILTDRLHPDTLETRIQQWQQQGRCSTPCTTATNFIDLYANLPTVSNTSSNEEDVDDPNDDDTIATPNDDLIPRKTTYAYQIAKAVQACHNAGIIVRDLSPQTIGFRHDDPHCIQLVDLGYAQEVAPPPQQEEKKKQQEGGGSQTDASSASTTKTMCGSDNGNGKNATTTTTTTTNLVGKRRYLPGEISRPGGCYTYKADVYSWAMIYYEMCMERKPFLGFSIQEHEKYVWEQGDRPLLSSCYLPEGIDNILTKAWAHRPVERSTIDEVVHQTQTLLLNLDSCCFWDPTPADFLFDVFVPTPSDPEDDEDADDQISELGIPPMEEEERDILVTEMESILEQQQRQEEQLRGTDDCLSLPSSTPTIGSGSHDDDGGGSSVAVARAA